MPKPTLLQTIFNQPSQSYQFPPEKQYHSTRQLLRRAAHDLPADPLISPSPPGLSSSAHSSAPSTIQDNPEFLLPSSLCSGFSQAASDPVNDRTSAYPRSASLSIASSSSLTTSSLASFHSQPSPLSTATSHYPDPMTSVKTFRFPTSNIPEEDPSDDDHTDIFYTPRSSLYSSPRVSRASSAFSDSKSSSAIVPPVPKLPSSDGPTARTSPPSESTSSSFSSSSSDLGSVLSSSTHATTSTRPTSPLHSDNSTKTPVTAQNGVRAVPVSKSTHHTSETPSSSSRHASKPNTRPPGVPPTAGHRRTRSQTENGRFAATDKDWAENVRWLSSNTPAAPAQRKAKKLPGRSQVAAATTSTRPNPRRIVSPASSSSGGLPYPPSAKSAELSASRNSRGSRGSRGRRRMSALLEEDESEELSDVTSAHSESSGSGSETSRPLSPPRVNESKVTTTKVTIIPTPEPSPEPTTVARRRSLSNRSNLAHQQNSNGDILTEEPEEYDADNPDNRLRAYARSNDNQRMSYRRLSRSLSLTHTDPRALSASLPTHTLPTPVSSSLTPATNGYVGLTLPNAGYSSPTKRRPPDSGKVDLPKSGVAQTSMATIEIIRGGANVQSSPSNSGGREKRRRQLSFSFKFLDGGKGNKLRKGKESAAPSYLLDGLPLPVAFTAHLSPPTYVPASHVLLKVFTVGLDSLDSLLVKHKLDTAGGKASKAVGHIPGRSLFGRVVQCGWDVGSDVCRKNDWVIALIDLRKSGALSEFVVVERHRMHRAPPPQFLAQPMESSTTHRRPPHGRSMSLPVNAPNPEYRGGVSSLGIEELSLLPLCAVPAHRAMRTFSDVLSSRLSRSKRAYGRLRAFVTNGHDGPGEIAVQLLRQRNVSVCVQVPQSLHPAMNGALNGKGNPNQHPTMEEFEQVEARLHAWGVEEIHVGNPLTVVERLAAEKQSFDLFLDTIGGIEIWEAAQRMLLAEPENISMSPSDGPETKQQDSKTAVSHAHFTTLVGDHPTRPFPSAQDNIRSGFRSLRRAMSVSKSGASSNIPNSAASSSSSVAVKDGDNSISKGKAKRTSKRSVGYSFVNAIADVDFQGEDLTDSLNAVLGLVEKGWIRPWIGDNADSRSKVVMFERAPEVFRRNALGPVGPLADGGTCVVKIAG